ncbi:type IV pilus biogenesis protein PilM [Salmonella enterica]|nr:hypothetical protein [Salmonella enterica subsp. enterica serovar Mbandaka]EEJ1220470.1 type IV pilus biogenesis protein PilM [Salmonella enterica]ELK3355878.1 type IV pilus biogenesis protein PilM [Salmonella enterica]
MNASYLGFVIMLIVSSFILGVVSDREKKTYDESIIQQQVASYLHYVDSAQAYINNNPSASGNITQIISLPNWLPKNTNITVYVQAGSTYVFMPNKPGLMKLLKNSTGDSISFGLATAGSIVTTYEKRTKPNFIPDNSVVFIL